MNFKKLTSLLLTLVMVVSLIPMAAFAEAPSTETEPTTSFEQQDEIKEDSSDESEEEVSSESEEATSDESEEEASSESEEVTSDESEEPAEPTAVEKVQAKIDALPDVEELADITAEEAATLNETVTAISLEIDKLSEEEKATLVMDKVVAVAGFLATWVAPVEDSTTVNVVKYNGPYGDVSEDSLASTFRIPVYCTMGLWIGFTDVNNNPITSGISYDNPYVKNTDNNRYYLEFLSENMSDVGKTVPYTVPFTVNGKTVNVTITIEYNGLDGINIYERYNNDNGVEYNNMSNMDYGRDDGTGGWTGVNDGVNDSGWTPAINEDEEKTFIARDAGGNIVPASNIVCTASDVFAVTKNSDNSISVKVKDSATFDASAEYPIKFEYTVEEQKYSCTLF